MYQVTADDFLACVERLDGKSLKTLAREVEFIVHFHKDAASFTVSSGKERSFRRRYIERVCRIFSEKASFRTKDYPGFNASYTLAIIDRCIRERESAT